MDLNLTNHRQARYQRQWSTTQWRICAALVLGLLLSLLPYGWALSKRQSVGAAWQAAQVEAHALQAKQDQWEEITQAWARWESQRQVWLQVGQKSQTPLRVWHWLNTATTHGVRWTQWQQDGPRWTVSGEAKSLGDVRQWLARGAYRPTPVDREVVVSQTEQWADGRIGFVLMWEELP